MGKETGGHSEYKNRETDVICIFGSTFDKWHTREEDQHVRR